MEQKNIEEILKECFISSCNFYAQEGAKKHEYEFCERTIMNYLDYTKRRRKEQELSTALD